MLSETKSASDTHLYRPESKSLLLPLKLLSSINSDNILQYRSENKIRNHSIKSSMESINDNYQRFSNNYLINTHFPIANVHRDSITASRTSSSQLPTVPKQGGTFIHRLVNKFFSITNTNENKKTFDKAKTKNELFPMKRSRREQLNTLVKSDDSHTLLNITSNRPVTSKRRKRRQRSNNNKHCAVCRRYRNCFSILPMNKIQPLPADSLEYTFESPMILNTNATTTQQNHSILTSKPSILSPQIQLEKIRTIDETQCQTIASAVELIFDTLMSNYQHV